MAARRPDTRSCSGRIRAWAPLLVLLAATVLLAGLSPRQPATAQAATYRLPVPAGEEIEVAQGIGGSFSHHSGSNSHYAIDFARGGRGFTVAAARPGTVSGADGSSDTQCSDLHIKRDGSKLQRCWAYANYVLIDHGDGTSSLYLHLAQDTVQVKAGDQVAAGDALGTAGTTGFSTGIHLHFQVQESRCAQDDAKQRDTCRAKRGWWMGRSRSLAFSDPSVTDKHKDGVPRSASQCNPRHTRELAGCNVYKASNDALAGAPPPSRAPTVHTASPTATRTVITPSVVVPAPAPQPPAPAPLPRIVYSTYGRSNATAPAMVINADGTGGQEVLRGVSGLFLSLAANPFAPDGQSLIFLRCPSLTGSGQLYATLLVARPDGSGERVLSSAARRCYTESLQGGFSWSPDSRQFVFYQMEPPGLFIANADGTGHRKLADGAFPAWSPTGTHIAFTVHAGRSCQVFTIKPDGSDRRQIADVPCEIGPLEFWGPSARWSPDGNAVLFGARALPAPQYSESPSDIYIVRLDRGVPTQPHKVATGAVSAAWLDCRRPGFGCEARVTNLDGDSLNIREFSRTRTPATGRLVEGQRVCLMGDRIRSDDGIVWWPVLNGSTIGYVAAFSQQRPDRPWVTPTGAACIP